MRIGGLQKLTLLDYPGKVACTVFLSGCNLRCPYCIFHKRYGKLCGSGCLLLYKNRSDRRRDRNGSVVCRENHGIHGGAG